MVKQSGVCMHFLPKAPSGSRAVAVIFFALFAIRDCLQPSASIIYSFFLLCNLSLLATVIVPPRPCASTAWPSAPPPSSPFAPFQVRNSRLFSFVLLRSFFFRDGDGIFFQNKWISASDELIVVPECFHTTDG